MGYRERIIWMDAPKGKNVRKKIKLSAAFYAVWGIFYIIALWTINGCSQGDNLTEQEFVYRFALYVDVPKSDYWDQVEKGMNRAFQAIQFELEKKYSIQNDHEAMSSSLRASANPLGACAVALQNDEAAQKTILDAMQRGVPVVCIGNDLNRSTRMGAVLTNYYEAGRKAGRFYARNLRQGTVVVLGTLPVPSTREEVWEGVQHGLGLNRRLALQIVKSEQPAEIRLQIQQALVNPKVGGVFLIGADTIESGAATIRNIGANRPLMMGGLSHRQPHEEMVQNGPFGLMMIENPEEIGYRAGRFMRDLSTGRGDLNTQIFVPCGVYRK